MHKLSKAGCSALALVLPFFWAVSGADLACGGQGADACATELEETSNLLQVAMAAAEHDEPTEEEQKAYQDYADAVGAAMATAEHANPQSTRRCDLKSPDDCPITDHASFSTKIFTRVYPSDKDTVCLDGSEFFFEVTRGKSKKLHIHFQGGGACWNQLSYAVDACYKNAVPQKLEGLFNRSEPRNPLKDYSTIVIQYCGGDMHTGRTEHQWGPKRGMYGGGRRTTTKQHGYYNANAAIQYALTNFPKLESLVISGSSAGSLGMQYWSGKLIELFANRNPQVSVVADSFLGILWPPGMTQTSEAWLFDVYDMCNPAVLTSAQMAKCNDKELLLQQMFADSMRTNPNVRFSTINSKADHTQITFEKAFELTAERNVFGAAMTNGQFYKSASLQVEEYLKFENVYSYFVDGPTHTFAPCEYIYTTSPEGNGTDGTSGSPPMIDWLTDFLNTSKKPTRSVCDGPVKKITARTRVGRDECDYCAEGVVDVQ